MKRSDALYFSGVVLCAAAMLTSCGITPKRSAALPPFTQVKAEPGAPAEIERDDSFAEAAKFDLLKRTGGAPLSMDRLFEARRHAQNMPLYSLANRRFVNRSNGPRAEASMGLGMWQPLGPGNVGGRTRALAIRPDDPKTIFAGSVGGGVWKTTDGGQTWNPLTDLLPSLSISTLAIDPNNPDTMYAGTGEWFTLIYGGDLVGDSVRGAGIYKSTDGGATWTQLPKTTSSGFYYVNKLVVSPNDGNRVYAATWAGIYLSRDAGATWSLLLNRASPHYGCHDLAIRNDQATDYVFASCAISFEPSPAIFRNVDAAGSGTWETVHTPTNMGRTALALAPSNQSEIYAVSASSESGKFDEGLLAVYRSTSNGDPGTWQTQVSNQDATRLNTVLLSHPSLAFADTCSGGTASYTNQGEYDLSIAVDPLNPDVVWVGGIFIFRSDDGGQNWGIASFQQTGAHPDNHAIVFPPNYNGTDVQTMYVAGDGGIYKTDNAAAATATGDRAACSPFPTQVTWTNLNNGYAVTQFYAGAVFPGGGAYLGGTQDNGTQRGSDASGALAWRKVVGSDGGFVAIDPKDPNLWYAESQNLNLVRTLDGGNTFFTATRGITEPSTNFLFMAPFVMDPSKSARLYVGGLTLWRTDDGAQTWTAVSTGNKSSIGPVSAIAVAPSDSDHVVFGTAAGMVFRTAAATTADKTTIWDSSQPRSGFLSSLAFDPKDPTIVYATYSRYKSSASQSHVYKSTDGGGTWTGIDGTGDTGLPDVPVFSIIVDPQNSSNLYVGSDIGVFVSVDGGATWARDANPFADTVTEILQLDRSAGQSTLFAFTHGRGVWKVALPGSGDPCQYSVAANSASIPALGAPLTFQVTTADGCSWSAIPQDPGTVVASPAAGKGNGSFTVTAGMNASIQSRVVNVFVQDKLAAIRQDAAPAASGNDDVATPFPLGDLPAVFARDTTSATESDSDPVHSCTKSADKKTLWYTVTAPDAGILHFSLVNRRLDNGADSGTVYTLYPVGKPTADAELGCFIVPQAAAGQATTLNLQATGVRKGDSFLIEVSATASGATAKSQILGGNFGIAAVLSK